MNKITSNPVGRPREHNRDQIAQDMIEWARRPDSINLNKFCALYDPPIPPSKITHWAKEEDGFRQACALRRRLYLQWANLRTGDG